MRKLTRSLLAGLALHAAAGVTPAPAQTFTLGNASLWDGQLQSLTGSSEYVSFKVFLYSPIFTGISIYGYSGPNTAPPVAIVAPAHATALTSFSLWFLLDPDLCGGVAATCNTGSASLFAQSVGTGLLKWSSVFVAAGGGTPLRHDFYVDVPVTPGELYFISLSSPDPHVPGYHDRGVDGTGFYLAGYPAGSTEPFLFEATFSVTPEPTSLTLLVIGLLLLAVVGRVRSRLPFPQPPVASRTSVVPKPGPTQKLQVIRVSPDQVDRFLTKPCHPCPSR